MTKIENILTHYLVTKAESNYEKNWSKSCLTVPLKRIRKSHLTQRSKILRGTSKKFEYLGEYETEFENILTHWSVAQAGSNDEKNWGSKISLDCPFKHIKCKSHQSR